MYCAVHVIRRLYIGLPVDGFVRPPLPIVVDYRQVGQAGVFVIVIVTVFVNSMLAHLLAVFLLRVVVVAMGVVDTFVHVYNDRFVCGTVFDVSVVAALVLPVAPTKYLYCRPDATATASAQRRRPWAFTSSSTSVVHSGRGPPHHCILPPPGCCPCPTKTARYSWLVRRPKMHFASM
jgi:hypothetical protein